MEHRKLDLNFIQLFPRTVEHSLAPQHVEQSDFVAECRHVEGFGDAWLLHQQKPPHLVAHVQFATDEADFDKKLGTAIALQQLHECIEGNLTFFCMLAGINAVEVPSTWPDRIRCARPRSQYRHKVVARVWKRCSSIINTEYYPNLSSSKF